MHNTKKIYPKLFLLMIIFGALFWGWSKYRKNFELPDKIPFAFSEPRALNFPENICNIADFGAIPDGETKNTESFKKAIETCAKKGGGKVFVPEGRWLTGAIHLKSNINLNLDAKAEILFSGDPDDYLPVVFTRFEGMELHNYSSLIYAKDAKNIAITGKGTLNGQGEFWQSWKATEKKSIEKLAEMVKNDVSPEDRIFGFSASGLRPSFIGLVNCQNIWLNDFRIIASPRWTIHPIYSENILMENLDVDTPGFNSDGIVIDSSREVLIKNCRLKTGDDTIAIKSGLEKDGWRVNRPSENIVIRDTRIEEGHSGIAIGSEMSGGVRNVFLYNLYFDGIDQGIRAKSTKSRGGYVENIWAKNISINIATNSAFQIDSTYPASAIKSNNKKAPVLRNFFVENLSVGSVKRVIVIDGLKDEPISDVSFSSIRAKSEKSNLLQNCKNIIFKKSGFDGPDKDAPFETKNCEYTFD